MISRFTIHGSVSENSKLACAARFRSTSSACSTTAPICFEHVRQRAAHERIVRQVGVRCQQDAERCVLGRRVRQPRGFELAQTRALRRRRRAFGLVLRSAGGFPGAFRLARADV